MDKGIERQNGDNSGVFGGIFNFFFPDKKNEKPRHVGLIDEDV